MLPYLARKIGAAILVLIGITAFAFLLGVLSPGDPAEISLSSGGNYTPSGEELRAVRARMGLDRPYHVQYAKWLTRVARGDLGRSFRTGRPVSAELLSRLPVTASIAGLSILLTTLVGVGVGVAMVLRPRGVWHQAGEFFSMLVISLPSFWFALLLIYLFSENLRWLPTSGQGTWKHLVMPVVVLSAGSAGMVIRLTRSSLETQMRRHYVLVAASKGMSRGRMIFSHVLINALIPVVTLLGNSLGAILGGSVIVESVFAVNGMGKFAMESISMRDYPALQGYVIITGLTFVAIYLLLDVLYLLINPQVRLGGERIF